MSSYQSRLPALFADGRKVVDWAVVWRVYFDLYRVQNYCDRRYQSRVTIDGDITSLEIDFEGAAADACMDANEAVRDLWQSVAQTDYRSSDLKAQLEAELGLLGSAQQRFQNLLADNTRQTMKALQASADRWELGHTLLVGTRDLAVIVLAAGGAVLTGGSSAAIGPGLTAMLFSDGLSNIGKMQDKTKTMTLSESVGEVTASTIVDFTFSLVTFGLGKGLKAGSKVIKQAVVIVVKTGGTTANALIAAEPGLDGKPKSLGEATGGAYVDAVLDGGIGVALDTRFGKGVSKFLRRTPIPGVTSIVKAASSKGKLALTKAAQSKGEKAIKDGISGAVAGFVGNVADEKAKPLIRAPICTGAASNKARLAALFPGP